MTKVQNNSPAVEMLPEEFALVIQKHAENGTILSARQYPANLTSPVYGSFPSYVVVHPAARWQLREAIAMADRREVPWCNEPWYQAKRFEHFAYLSAREPGLIAYTQDAAKGQRDIQTPVRPGRYLRRFFADVLTEAEIEQWATEVTVLSDAMGLTITQDADEIQEVYENGPSSCMSYDESHFDGPCHPVRVYAGPDLAVAYTGPSDSPSQRAVVWPERKVYSTVYGGAGGGGVLAQLLEAAGYKPGSLRGARIRRIPSAYGFVMPYVDDCCYAQDDGEFIVLGRGDLSCRGTEGVTEDDRPTCERCGDRCDAEDTCTVETGRGYTEEWCYHCTVELSTYCDHTGERYADYRYSFVEIHGTRDTVCVEAAEDDIVEIDGRWYYTRDTFECAECGERFPDDDMHSAHNSTGSYVDCCGECHAALTEGEETAAEQPAPSPLPAPEAPAQGQFRLWGKRPHEAAPFAVWLTPPNLPHSKGSLTGSHEIALRTARELGQLYPNVTYTVAPADTPEHLVALAAAA